MPDTKKHIIFPVDEFDCLKQSAICLLLHSLTCCLGKEEEFHITVLIIKCYSMVINKMFFSLYIKETYLIKTCLLINHSELISHA